MQDITSPTAGVRAMMPAPTLGAPPWSRVLGRWCHLSPQPGLGGTQGAAWLRGFAPTSALASNAAFPCLRSF